jgi:hypothetical protein
MGVGAEEAMLSNESFNCRLGKPTKVRQHVNISKSLDNSIIIIIMDVGVKILVEKREVHWNLHQIFAKPQKNS